MSRGEWRFAITDEHGQLLHAGITRARPTSSARRWAGSREIVELQIPAITLRELASDLDAVGRWEPVITDLAHQYANALRPPEGDLTRRAPGAALRRYLEIRDRRCIMIGCRAPARGADADHTLDHVRKGPTAEHNLCHTCRHDHRLKHDGGWHLEQPEPGHFRWTSRLGHAYPVQARPIIEPLPDPIARSEPAPPLAIPAGNDLGIWDDDPPEPDNRSVPGPAPPHDPDEDPPPF
jgi:hypothetical protein